VEEEVLDGVDACEGDPLEAFDFNQPFLLPGAERHRHRFYGRYCERLASQRPHRVGEVLARGDVVTGAVRDLGDAVKQAADKVWALFDKVVAELDFQAFLIGYLSDGAFLNILPDPGAMRWGSEIEKLTQEVQQSLKDTGSAVRRCDTGAMKLRFEYVLFKVPYADQKILLRATGVVKDLTKPKSGRYWILIGVGVVLIIIALIWTTRR